MKASTIRRMLDLGITVSIIKKGGITEKFHPLKNGAIAVTYSGIGVCMCCGRISRGNCSCSGELETISLTGCFRHINSRVQSICEAEFDEEKKHLKVTEV